MNKKKTGKYCFLGLFLVLFAFFATSFSAAALGNKPGRVSGLTVKNESYRVSIKWEIEENADGYKIYRKESKNGKSTLIGRQKGSEKNSFYDSKASSGKMYYYSVCAYQGDYDASRSFEKSTLFISSAKIKSGDNCYGYLKLTWAKVAKAEGYVIYRAPENGAWVKLGTAKATQTTFNDKTALSGTIYKYTVITRYGEKLSVKDGGFKKRYIAAPTELTLKNAHNKIYFTWNKVNGAQGYIVYRKDGTNGKWVNLGEFSQTKYIDENIKNGGKYIYTVKAVASDGAISSYKATEEYMALYKLTGVSVTNKPKAVRLNWKKSTVGTGYKIFRFENGQWKYIQKIANRSTTSFDDKTVKSGQSYTYMVRSYYSNSLGSFDTKGITAEYYTAPDMKVKHSPKGVVLYWNKAPKGQSYTIYHKAEGDKGWQELTVLMSTAYTSFTHKKPDFGKLNYYKLQVNGVNTKTVSYERSLYGIDPKKKVVALTYDDGPYGPVTNSVLNTLSEYDSRATFFVVGNRVNSYKSSLKWAVNIGCEIGNHSYSHTILTKASTDTIKSQINKTNSLVKNITGVTPQIVRAPGGSVNSKVRNNVKYPLVNWSVDTIDWKSRNSSAVVKEIKGNVKDGSIILMHDLYKSTATATEIIVPWLVENGYQLVTVSELMQIKGVDMNAGTVYYSATNYR